MITQQQQNTPPPHPYPSSCANQPQGPNECQQRPDRFASRVADRIQQTVQPAAYEIQVVMDKELRRDLDAQLQKLKSMPPSRERSLAITKLQEGIMWLGMDLKRLNGDPSNTNIEPTADGPTL